MHKKLAAGLLGLIAVGLSSAAGAATVLDDYQGTYNSVPFNVQFSVGDNGTAGTASVGLNQAALSNAQIVQGNSGGQYASPYGLTSQYIAVYSGGSATYTLTQPSNYFGFLWGSVDSYNNVKLTLTNGKTLYFSGDDIISNEHFSSGDQGIAGTYYANFVTTGAALIKSVVLSSTGNSFEFGNTRVSAVPIPGALLLFGSALTGLGVVARKARRRIG